MVPQTKVSSKKPQLKELWVLGNLDLRVSSSQGFLELVNSSKEIILKRKGDYARTTHKGF